MPSRCCEFVDSRRRRCPPDRASAVPYGQAGGNAMRFPHLAHRLAAAPQASQHSATARDDFDFGGMVKSAAGSTPLAYSSPEAVQTTGAVALRVRKFLDVRGFQTAEAVEHEIRP